MRVEGEDRAGVERLVRYCARGPLALERLHALGGQEALASPSARLVYRLAQPDLQGRTALLLTPIELLERLARLIPPPRVHRHRLPYHGLHAPHARLRAAVVAIGRETQETAKTPEAPGPDTLPEPSPTPAPPAAAPPATPDGSPPPSRARLRWAQLIARVYEVLPLLCPACGGEMRILAFLTDPPVVQALLLHLHLPHRPPPIAPARGPPQAELDLDQTPAFDLSDPEPAPDFDFDQSPPENREGNRAASRPNACSRPSSAS